MSTATALMTTEQLLALPEDGMERDLIRGELRERPMTRRNRFHSETEATVVHYLKAWLLQQPNPRGKVYSGQAGCILRRNPDSTVGIDVCYVSAEVVARQTDDTQMIEGAPILAVEVQSANDTVEETEEKIDEYLSAGVALAWVVNPYRKTVTAYRPGVEPEFFTVTQALTAEPHLPGFKVSVAALFE